MHKRMARAGSMESSDVLVVIRENEGLSLVINSVVKNQFGEQIKALVQTIMDEHQLKDVEVLIQDRGALDYAITARMETAIQRYREEV